MQPFTLSWRSEIAGLFARQPRRLCRNQNAVVWRGLDFPRSPVSFESQAPVDNRDGQELACVARRPRTQGRLHREAVTRLERFLALTSAQRVSGAPSHRWRFVPRNGCRPNKQIVNAGTSGYERRLRYRPQRPRTPGNTGELRSLSLRFSDTHSEGKRRRRQELLLSIHAFFRIVPKDTQRAWEGVLHTLLTIR